MVTVKSSSVAIWKSNWVLQLGSLIKKLAFVIS